MSDYYATLGVQRDADDTTLKRAFRDQARRLHPDVNRHDAEAEEKFKLLNEAYEVLSDPKRRAMYDRYGTVRPQDVGGFAGADDLGFGSVADIFGMFFGDMGGQRRPDLSGRDIAIEVQVDLEEAVFGVSKDVQVERAVSCDACEATGAKPGTSPDTCPDCKGSGVVRMRQQALIGTVMREAPCVRCGGLGQVIAQPCPQCEGQGRRLSSDALTVDLPAGVDDGMTMRVNGAGEAGLRGARQGDLFVHVRLRPHQVFDRHGDDLYAVLPLTFAQASLGSRLSVPGLGDDAVKVSVPAGTQPGDRFVVKGKGVSRLRRKGRGDLIIEATVEVPRKVSSKERKLIQEFDSHQDGERPPGLVSPRAMRSS